MAKMILLQQGQAIPYEITGDEATIGRLPECEIQLNSNMVSRKHARVIRQESGFAIEDLGSGNGTFLNGQRIEGTVKLKPGDRIKFGPILRLRCAGRAAGSQTQGDSRNQPGAGRYARRGKAAATNSRFAVLDLPARRPRLHSPEGG